MDDRVLAQLLVRQAGALGDRPFVRVGAVERSFAEMRAAAAGLAGAFAAAGIGRGDRVAVLAGNRIELLDAFMASSWLGAILVPINTASRGPQLEHILSNAAPLALAFEPELGASLDTVEQLPDSLETLWRLGDGPTRYRGVAVTPFPRPRDALEPAPTGPGDTVAVLYTSGTTGPSKGVCCPSAQFYWWGRNTAAALGITSADILYTCLPLFHTNALNTFVQALLNGIRLEIGDRFSASRFWQRIVDADATVTYLLGAMVSILAKREPEPIHREHKLRIALAPATPVELHGVFRERFGVELVEAHGMTETNFAIGPRDGEQRAGCMGRVLPGFEARVVDEDDQEVEDGTSGELVLRSDEPWAFATGYWRMPEHTVTAWRNLWFHSGDRVVRDADGYFRFLDRMKDAIRRRGENVSAWEVEQVLQMHRDVEAAAVVPVPSELGEDEVMAFVVPRGCAELDPVELVAHCGPRLPYFAIPRYVDVVSELPLTENGKVRKFLLRERGVTATTWDRETAQRSGEQ